MDSIRLNAMAKINLGLDVVRKREDGYHDLDMIMQMVDVYDDIIIEKNNIEDEDYKYKVSKYGRLTKWLEELITRIKTI